MGDGTQLKPQCHNPEQKVDSCRLDAGVPGGKPQSLTLSAHSDSGASGSGVAIFQFALRRKGDGNGKKHAT